MIRLVLFCLFLAGPAMATVDGFPALFNVSGVASDDTLNVRMEPSASSDIVGELEANAIGVEVLRLDPTGNWARVAVDPETMGWVAVRFLERQPGFVAGTLPDKLSCSGTEPFWSMSLSQDGGLYRTPDESLALYNHVTSTRSANRTDRFTQFFAGASGVVVATLTNGSCFNMMSGAESGWSVELLRSETTIDKSLMLSGCCSVAQ